MSAREKFEAWATAHDFNTNRFVTSPDGPVYIYGGTEWAWLAWQASRLAAKADDAEICDQVDRRGDVCDNPAVFAALHESESKACAAAIRASDAIGGR